MGVLAVKAHEHVSNIGLQTFISPMPVHTNPPGIHQYYHLIVPVSLQLQCLLTQINSSELWSSVFPCLSRFQCGGVSYDFSSLMGQTMSFIFILLHFSPVLKIGSTVSKLLKCRS